MMDVDAVGSDFEEPESDMPPPKKKPAAKTATTKRAPAKKPPAKGRGKKVVEVRLLSTGVHSFVVLIPILQSDSDDNHDDVIQVEQEEVPKRRTNRAAVLRLAVVGLVSSHCPDPSARQPNNNKSTS